MFYYDDSDDEVHIHPFSLMGRAFHQNDYDLIEPEDVLRLALMRQMLRVRTESAQEERAEPRKEEIRSLEEARNLRYDELRRSCHATATALGPLFNEPRYSDMMLEVGQHSFYAHRIVLCSWSDVFKTMFAAPQWQHAAQYQNDAPSTSKYGGSGTYRLVEDADCVDAFGDFLKYLYTETITVSNKNFLALVRLSDKYFIRELRQVCDKFFADHKNNIPDVVALLRQAADFKMQGIVESCLEVLRVNFDEVMQEQLLTLDSSMIVFLLENVLNLVVTDEFTVFEKLMPWLTECIDDKIFIKVIDLLRFPLMNALQLKDVSKSHLLSRIQNYRPNFLIEAYQQHSLYSESYTNELSVPFPEPRLYMRKAKDFEKMNSQNSTDLEKLGFQKMHMGQKERIENVLAGERCTSDRNVVYRADSSRSWNVEVNPMRGSKEGRKGCENTWGARITVSRRPHQIDLYHDSYSKQRAKGAVRLEIAVQIRFPAGASYAFAIVDKLPGCKKRYLRMDKEEFDFETPTILAIKPVSCHIRVAILVHPLHLPQRDPDEDVDEDVDEDDEEDDDEDADKDDDEDEDEDVY